MDPNEADAPSESDQRLFLEQIMSPGQANEIKFLEWLKENEPEQYKSA